MNVHKSAADEKTMVACGDLARRWTRAASPGIDTQDGRLHHQGAGRPVY